MPVEDCGGAAAEECGPAATRPRRGSSRWRPMLVTSAKQHPAAAASADEKKTLQETEKEEESPVGVDAKNTAATTAVATTSAASAASAPQQQQQQQQQQQLVPSPGLLALLAELPSEEQREELSMLLDALTTENVQWRRDRLGCCVLRITVTRSDSSGSGGNNNSGGGGAAAATWQLQLGLRLPREYPAEGFPAEVSVLSGTIPAAWRVQAELQEFCDTMCGAPVVLPVVAMAQGLADECVPGELSSRFGICPACCRLMRRAPNASVLPQPLLPAADDETGEPASDQWRCGECGGPATLVPSLVYATGSTGRLHFTTAPPLPTGGGRSGKSRGAGGSSSSAAEAKEAEAAAQLFASCAFCLCDAAGVMVSLACGCWACHACFVRMCEIEIGSKTLLRVAVPPRRHLPRPSAWLARTDLRQRAADSDATTRKVRRGDRTFPPPSLLGLGNEQHALVRRQAEPVVMVGIPCPNHLAAVHKYMRARRERAEREAAAAEAQTHAAGAAAADSGGGSEQPHEGKNENNNEERGKEKKKEEEETVLSKRLRVAGDEVYATEPYAVHSPQLIQLLRPRYMRQFIFFAMEEALKGIRGVLYCPLPRCYSYPFISEHYGTHPMCPYCHKFFCVRCHRASKQCCCEELGTIEIDPSIFGSPGLFLADCLRLSSAEEPPPIEDHDGDVVRVVRVLCNKGEAWQLPLDGHWLCYAQLYNRNAYLEAPGHLIRESNAFALVFNGVVLDPLKSLRDQYVHDGAYVFLVELYTLSPFINVGERLARAANLRTHAIADADVASSKKCPTCNKPVIHHLGHGCHIISGCSSGCREWCYVCGSFSSGHVCPNGCPVFCRYTTTVNAATKELEVTREGCSCSLCVSCKPFRPCSLCTGSCPVCGC